MENRTRTINRQHGFTLSELMMAVAVIAVLTATALPTFSGYIAKAKRPEVFATLRAIADAETAFREERGYFSGKFTALNIDLDTGYVQSAKTLSGKYYTYRLSQPFGPQSWYCVATGNVDNDPWLDIIVAGNFDTW